MSTRRANVALWMLCCALVTLFLVVVDNAEAREYAAPPTLEQGQDQYVQNPDGTYTEYLGGKDGVPLQGNTYTEQGIKESDAIFAETAVETGGAETPSDIVPEGADWGYSAETTEEASGQIQMALDTGEPYKTAGEAAVGDGEIAEGISSGWLPSAGAAMTASAGVIAGSLTVASGLVWGVELGDLADKYLFHIPTLTETLFGTSNSETKGAPIGTQGWFETPRGGYICYPPAEVNGVKCFRPEREMLWSPYGEELEGRVYPCNEAPNGFHGGTHELFPGGTADCFGMVIRGTELYRYISGYYGAYGAEQSGTLPLVIDGDGDQTGKLESWLQPDLNCPAGLYPFPEKGVHGPYCQAEVDEPGAENQASVGWAYEPLNEALFEGYPSESFGGETCSTCASHRIAEPATPEKPKEITPPAPSHVPGKDVHKIIEKAHEPVPKKEEEEPGYKPIPLIPPLEPGPNTIPNPSNPTVPQPHKDEPAEEYNHEVEKEGELKPEDYTLPENDVDTETGPGDAAAPDISPAPGTSVEPGTKVRVGVNPDTAPPGGGEKGGIGPPTEPGINLPHLTLLCTTFPFGVPCWLKKQLEAFSASSAAPVWTIGPFEWSGNKIPKAEIDLAKIESIMEIVRPFMIIFGGIGIVFFFYKVFTGNSIGGGENPSGEVPGPGEGGFETEVKPEDGYGAGGF